MTCDHDWVPVASPTGGVSEKWNPVPVSVVFTYRCSNCGEVGYPLYEETWS